MKNHNNILRFWLPAAAVLVVLLSIVVSTSIAGDKQEQPHYLIITPHTPAQCLASLDSYAAKDAKLLEKIDWGCADGDHSGYLVVDAANKKAARDLLPAGEQEGAKIVKLNKFTVEQIAEYHQKK